MLFFAISVSSAQGQTMTNLTLEQLPGSTSIWLHLQKISFFNVCFCYFFYMLLNSLLFKVG